MNSSVVKRSVVIAGHKTGVSLEDEFWMLFKQIAGYQLTTVSALLMDFYREQYADGEGPVTKTHRSPLSPLQ
jgi:predicted DNA-binding ribbon-helix-helix protein